MKLYVDKKEANIHKHKKHWHKHHQHKHHRHQKQSSMEISERHEKQQKITPPSHEAVAIEEAVLFDEKEEIKGGADGHHVLASNQNKLWVTNEEDRNIAHNTFSGQCTVSAARGPDYSLGAEPVDIEGRHCTTATEEGRAGLKNSVTLMVHSQREVPISKKGTKRMNSQSQLGKRMKREHHF
jgi:hypothetical protein